VHSYSPALWELRFLGIEVIMMSISCRYRRFWPLSGGQKKISVLCDLPVSVGLFVLPFSLVNLFIDDFRHLWVITAVPAVGWFKG